MKRILSVSAACALAAGSVLLMSQPASAETYDGQACQYVDTSATVGSAIVYTVPVGCSGLTYEIGTGSHPGGAPTITEELVGSPRLIWQQEVERDSMTAACPTGWSGSWSQWAKGGTGGATCVKLVDWGVAPPNQQQVTVTINTEDDFVVLSSSGATQWATGCAPATLADPDFYDDHQIYCPV